MSAQPHVPNVISGASSASPQSTSGVKVLTRKPSFNSDAHDSQRTGGATAQHTHRAAVQNPPPPSSTASLQLTNSAGEFLHPNARCIEAHLLCTARASSANPLLVITATGAQASGKSTLLNMLGHLTTATERKDAPLRQQSFHVAPSTAAATERHTTAGISVRFARTSRSILVDTAPLRSCSRLADVLHTSDAASHHPQIDLMHERTQLLELISSLLTSHVLLICTDGLKDRRMWHLLRLAHSLVPSISGCPEVANGGPQIVLVHSHAHTSSPEHDEAELCAEAQQFFAGTSIAFTEGANCPTNCKGSFRPRTIVHVLPNGSLDDVEVCSSMDRLYDRVHSMRPKVKKRALSECEWLEGLECAWQSIDACEDFINFYNATAKRNFRTGPELKYPGESGQQQDDNMPKQQPANHDEKRISKGREDERKGSSLRKSHFYAEKRDQQSPKRTATFQRQHQLVYKEKRSSGTETSVHIRDGGS